MELYSLHPFPDGAAEAFLRRVDEHGVITDGNTEEDLSDQFWFRRIVQRSPPRANDLSFGFAAWLALRQPVFAKQGLSLSTWEARIDRGSGMLLRPPSRLFGEAGLDVGIARAMPIRMASGDSMMGGAFLPARSTVTYLERLDSTLERSVRRLIDAELDPQAHMGVLYEAVRYAAVNGFGLYEAIDLLDPDDSSTWPASVQVVTHSTDRVLMERIRQASQPAKEPGLIARLFGRKR